MQLNDHSSSKVTKMILIGDSGAGKTGSLASLAWAGFNLRILDFDSGLDILSNLLRGEKTPYGPEAIKRIEYEPLTEKLVAMGGKLVRPLATVWPRLTHLLTNWHGGIHSWGSEDVLVIDSLTRLADAAMNYVLRINGRPDGPPQLADWGAGQKLIKTVFETLYDDNVKCNIIVIAHIAFIGEENGPQHGYPMSLGKALSPVIPTFFNSVIMVRRGQNGQRKIITTPQGLVELKTSNPLTVKAEYGLEFGLAEFFRDLRGEPLPRDKNSTPTTPTTTTTKGK